MHIPRNIVYALYGTILVLVALLVVSLHHHFPSYTAQNSDTNTPPIDVPVGEHPYLHDEEAVVVETDHAEEILPLEKVLFEYVEVQESCDVHFEGECVRIRSGPGLDFPVVTRVRNHVVLKIGGKVDHEGMTWYKIIFDEELRYPERITTDWYIASEYVDVLHDEGTKVLLPSASTIAPTQKIIVDIREQKLYAYEDDTLFMETSISTGLELSPTPKGTFTIFRKTPSRFMQGPLPGHSDVYDLPGVPWNLYFTHGGAVIHGAYWHSSFGNPYSHGCVNVVPEDARKLYYWAEPGTKVIVR